MKKQWLHNDETLESALTHLYYTTYSQGNVLNFQGTYGNGILIKSSIRRATHDIDYCTNMEAIFKMELSLFSAYYTHPEIPVRMGGYILIEKELLIFPQMRDNMIIEKECYR